MAKKSLSMPSAGTAPATPLQNMVHNNPTPKVAEEGDGYRRTTILVRNEEYKKFKAYAAMQETSVAALINGFIKDTLAKANK